jgi:subtilase family serine protease
MKTPRTALLRIVFAGAGVVLSLVLITNNARAAERQVLRGHVVSAVAELNLQPVGRLASSTNLDLAISLPLRNQDALTNLLQQQYAPTSPQYHHWLTPEEFAERFGPSEKDYQAVIEFAKSNGFTVTGTHSNRTLLDVRASAGNIERVFRVRLLAYQHPTEAREFYAPDVEPSLDLTVPVLRVTGLDNYSVPRPMSIQASPENKAADATPASGSGPSGSYRGYDFRSAYIPGVSLNGSGQVVALVEFDGYYPNDIAAYEGQAGLPDVPLQNVLLDGFSGTPTANAKQVQEVSLDIEMAISMAPGLSEVIVYEVPNNNTSFKIDVLNRIATDNLAKQISCSWILGDSTNFDQIYQQYASQGQAVFQSSGDNGAFTLLWPNQQQADSPYVTLVGGTTLTTTGPGGAWLTEKVWNWNNGTGLGETNDACGGGLSQGDVTYPIPSWQQGIDMTYNQGSTIVRNVPDVAMVADGVYVIYNNGSTSSSIGGTSAAAPLWAGFTALVNQQAVAYGQPTVGFINPAIYAIGTGTTYDACFHDIILGNNETYYSPFQFSAAVGYDLCTGWGTPNGSNLVNALAPQPQSGLTGYVFTKPSLWDMTGIYTNTDTSSGSNTVVLSLQQQANGKISGTRNETDVSGADFAEGSGPITGKIAARAGSVAANLKGSASVTGLSGGVAFTENAKIKETATIVPSSLTVLVSGSARVCEVGGKCVTSTEAISFSLPQGMNGDWTLGLNITTNGSKLVGTGTITLSNGRVLTYQVTGSYNNRSQTSKLKFVGEGDDVGTSLSLTTGGAGTNLTSLKGKVLGQSLKYP